MAGAAGSARRARTAAAWGRGLPASAAARAAHRPPPPRRGCRGRARPRRDGTGPGRCRAAPPPPGRECPAPRRRRRAGRRSSRRCPGIPARRCRAAAGRWHWRARGSPDRRGLARSAGSRGCWPAPGCRSSGHRGSRSRRSPRRGRRGTRAGRRAGRGGRRSPPRPRRCPARGRPRPPRPRPRRRGGGRARDGAREGQGPRRPAPGEGLGLRVPALDRVEAGEEEAGREARGVLGERRLDGAAGLRRLAGGEAGADEVGEGLAAARVAPPAAAVAPSRGPRASPPRRRACPRPGGGRRRGSRPSPSPRGSPWSRRRPATCPARAQSCAREVDAPEHVQELAVLGVAAERVDDDALGRAGAVLLHQETGVAQRFRRRPARELDRERQPLAHRGRARRRARGRRP